jgi:hypothetical protein
MKTPHAMLAEVFNQRCPLLPAWFTERMLNDQWYFGLLLVTGEVIGIHCIRSVIQAGDGSIWIDAEMFEEDEGGHEAFGRKVRTAPTKRCAISINANQVVAAFELADT